MKILTVTHRFPPRHHAGAEMYALRLGLQLARKHEVSVVTADDAIFRRNHSRRHYRMGPLEVTELINHRRFTEFRETYADTAMEFRFREILRSQRPEIVHFQHLLNHSVRYPMIAREEGVPSVMTLHEYWLLCARNGQLFRHDDERCERPRLDTCAECMSRFMWGRKGLDVWAIRGVTAVKRLTGVDLKARARKLRLKKVNDSEGGVDAGRIEDMKKDLLLREGEIRDMFEAVDCFVAPSKFLARQFADYGLDADRLVCSDYGTPVETFEPTPFPTEGPLRIGFLGSIQPVKGVHVLFDAATHLESGSFHLRIYGDAAAKPEYGIDLAALQSGDVEIVGRAHFSSIPEIIPTFDVLVCPSIWWENSPLVIHEAFAAGVPVICSGIGGMAELVEDGVNGFHYTAGDGEDLARKLKILIDDRTQLDRLRQGIPELKDMAEDAEFHEELFRTVLDQYR